MKASLELESFDSLREHLEAIDEEAIGRAKSTRWLLRRATWLHVAAASAAVTGLALYPVLGDKFHQPAAAKHVLLAGILIKVGALVAAATLIHKAFHHRRASWVTRRAKAELIRGFLCLCRLCPKTFPSPMSPLQELDGYAAELHGFRERTWPTLPNDLKALDLDQAKAVYAQPGYDTRSAQPHPRITSQIDYMRHKSRVAGAKARRLRRISNACLFFAIAAGAVALAWKAAAWPAPSGHHRPHAAASAGVPRSEAGHSRGELGKASPADHPVTDHPRAYLAFAALEIIGIVLPIAGTAAVSLLMAGDDARRSIRYASLEHRLDELQRRVTRCATFDELALVVAETEGVLLGELGEWWAMVNISEPE